ncbi:helix-turn-helix domain-containing protein [Deferribacter thermophilus]|uniref:helix-turn-helix domain-containing protein n=1 Tax=Deferribacter thermophilus TaxID=53573 RepID=UPI003C15E388
MSTKNNILGEKLRNLRKSQGYSLNQLAKVIGKTKSYLSMIENGKAIPSMATLKAITNFFNVTISDLLEEDEKNIHLNKESFDFKNDAELIYSKKGFYNLYLLIKNPLLKMKTYLVEIPPYGGYQQEIKHEGEEFGYVLNGEIELTLDNEKHIITSGNYFYFYSNKKHKVKNISSSTAKVLWVYLPK